jgi:hypothetical protein
MIEIATATISDFMRSLLVTEPHFSGGDWFFRGQADVRWGLVPSSRRWKSWERFGGAERHKLKCDADFVITSDKDLARVEKSLLHTLNDVVKRMGHPVHLEQGDDTLLAFAQHIGLPTRLLDWTRSPWTAAYFAAADAAKHSEKEGSLAIFAMSMVFLDHAPLRKLHISSGGNPNLLAQQGVLLELEGERADLIKDFDFKIRPVGHKPTIEERARNDHQFFRITLPWSLALDLLRTLRAQELHAATIYPGQVGIAELVRELFFTKAVTSAG